MDMAVIERKILRGEGTFKDLQKLASESGKRLADDIIKQVNDEYPNGNISEEDARRIVRPYLKKNHEYISEMTAAVIDAMYKKAEIGIKAITPEYNIAQENDLVRQIVNWSKTDELE